MQRLLMLVRLDENGRANERHYGRAIRTWLGGLVGTPPPTRTITDPAGWRSLTT